MPSTHPSSCRCCQRTTLCYLAAHGISQQTPLEKFIIQIKHKFHVLQIMLQSQGISDKITLFGMKSIPVAQIHNSTKGG